MKALLAGATDYGIRIRDGPQAMLSDPRHRTGGQSARSLSDIAFLLDCFQTQTYREIRHRRSLSSMVLTRKLADGVALNVGDGHPGSEGGRSPRAMAIMTVLGRRHVIDGIAEMGAARPWNRWPGC
jgi:hypothetical protein